MTYTFKLARRLAVLRPRRAALCALAALACAGSDVPTESDVSSLSDVRPAGGGKPGRKTLVGIQITPASAELQAGSAVQFAAAGLYGDGSSKPVSAAWSATGGTITTGGLYTGGAAAGTYHVVATAGGFGDTAAVTITGVTDTVAPAPAPSPPPAAGGLANECAAPRPEWIWCDDFEEDRLNRYFEYQAANGSFARASGVGAEGSWGMRARFAAGQVNAGALHLAFGRTPQSYFRAVDGGTADYREVYWRVYLRNQPGWTGGGGDKLSRATIFASSTSWAQAMIAHVWSGGSDPGWYSLVVDPASGTDAAGTLKTTKYNDFANLRWLGSDRGTERLFEPAAVGAWRCIEARARLNDAGQANGTFELWIDGRLDASRTGLNWVGSFDAYGINAVYLENYWNAGSPQAQERYMDNFVVSTGPIGC